MILVIDAGNTNIVFAVYKGKKVVATWRLTTDSRRTSDEYALAILQLFAMEAIAKKDISGAILSSVVPQAVFPLVKFCKDYLQCMPLIVGTPDVKLGVVAKITNPQEVGADRLVNAHAVHHTRKKDAIIIDFGTATTFDVVSKKGEYLGGVIAPGVNLSMEALHMAAAKLPKVAIMRPKHTIGRSTVEAMQSGVYWGYVSMIEGMVTRIQKEYGKKMTVIATGGLASLFAKATPVIEELNHDLTIEGLRLIYEMNTKKEK